MGTALAWGRHYVMVEPDHFRVDYGINPFMDLADQPDPIRAREQWGALVATIRSLGGTVDALPQRADAPDMVYAMNLGLGVEREDSAGDVSGHVVMSHMRYAERRMETATAQPWFAESGCTTSYVGRDGVGAHFEAGDAFAFGDSLVVGYGPRTEELALKHLAGRPRRPGPRPADHAPRHVPPRPRVLPARRDHRARLPRRVRRRVRGRAAGAGARGDGAHRGGGADHVRRQLDRAALGFWGQHRRDAGLPGPRASRSSRTGASRSSSWTCRSSTRAAARSAA